MSEFSAFMYVASAPLFPVRNPTATEDSQRRHQRSGSSSRPKTSRSHHPFRHARTSSASQSSRSRQEPSSSPSSASGHHPAVGDPSDASTRLDLQQHEHPPGRHDGTPASLRGSAADEKPHASSRVSSHAAPTTPLLLPLNQRASDRKYRSRGGVEVPTLAENAVLNTTPHHDQESSKFSLTSRHMNASFARSESISSASAATSLSTRTMTTDPSATGEKDNSKPFVQRNGRTYFNDPTLSYPLPIDLTELHRQCLRTLLLIQVFGAPVCSPALIKKPPQRVLEVGCGSGFWSMMCHRYFKGRGHSGISFTGIDIAPLAPGSANMPSDGVKPDRDMKWTFVQHDLRQRPWPLPSEEYDLVMVKDMSLATPNMQYQAFVDEYLRLLRPGGTLEIWESDQTIRMLRPHVPGSSSNDDSEEQEVASSLGAYVMTPNTSLSAPLNTFLVEYNHWLSRALESRELSAVPCTIIGPMLLQESEELTEVRSRRLAIPLSEVRWEREGVGGVVTKDGKSYVEMKGKAPHQKVEKKSLTSGQAALRKTALLTVVQQAQALEPILREVSGKSIDEWDVWVGKMMGDLMSESGTSWGECLEVGAWWARKTGA
ncbi:hypothetical protein S40293_06543 [Stachybotrys chartarum IBT 40293]|nr:hypothetical protein S40293_06543 [Stachybotrys chartarum IBT 40293]